MIFPDFLQKKDAIVIVAPANAVCSEEINPAIEIFKSWGLEVILSKNLFNIHHTFAGTDEERLEDLQNAIDDQKIKAIVCARGGYGTARIIDKLDFSQFIKNPKWLVGFSDITILHTHLHQLSIASIHGSMPLLFPKQTKAAIQSLKNTLFGHHVQIKTIPHLLNQKGKAKGVLIGGNLSLLVSSLGTKSEINTENKILFLEDVNEYVYHLDRMIVQLYRANKLKNLAGLVIGQFSEVKDNLKGFGASVEQTIIEWTKFYQYPIAFNFPIGHEEHNISVICGKEMNLIVGENESILFDE
ncbi:MAG: LD-carboxypeptidase [Bacteroidetes bacterium]|nr:MAG: LD-carboxypeptidase [Bacteroidota bacterium]TAG86484.1 MAG: LD-carboxypeptidase [Bacteroidota bacterium]